MEETIQQTIERIEPILKADITWSIFEGPGWDANQGAARVNAGSFAPDHGCGTCAMGSHVIRHCQDTSLFHMEKRDWEAAADSLKIDDQLSYEIYSAVADYAYAIDADEDGDDEALDHYEDQYEEGVWELAKRLCTHAEAEQVRKASAP